jgi:internalin A
MLLPNLTLLAIENAAITDRSLEPLFTLRKLQTLGLINTSVTDAGLKAIAEHFPMLKSLRVAITKITDEGVLHLQPMTEFIMLSLDGDGITNVGANHLALLTRNH